MSLYALHTPEDVDAFLTENPLCAIFKAGTCHKTNQGFSVLERLLRDRDLTMGLIRVVEHRPASNHVVALTGITHHSPQFVLFKGGQAVFDVDNWNITEEVVAPIFEAHVPLSSTEKTLTTADNSSAKTQNLAPYTDLLERYLAGQMGDAQFQSIYVNMFRDDASLHSSEQFELLSKLFGDPDAYHGGLHQLVPATQFVDMRGAAGTLLEQLRAL
jgi:bacillithiol system protein YtxJ